MEHFRSGQKRPRSFDHIIYWSINHAACCIRSIASCTLAAWLPRIADATYKIIQKPDCNAEQRTDSTRVQYFSSYDEYVFYCSSTTQEVHHGPPVPSFYVLRYSLMAIKLLLRSIIIITSSTTLALSSSLLILEYTFRTPTPRTEY